MARQIISTMRRMFTHRKYRNISVEPLDAHRNCKKKLKQTQDAMSGPEPVIGIASRIP